MKKIAFLIPTLSNGGAEKVISIITNYLPLGFDKYIILYNKENITYSYDAKLIFLNYKTPKHKYNILNKIHKIINFPILVYRLKKIKKEYQFDVVISFLNHFNILNIMTKYSEKTVISVRNYISLQHIGVSGWIIRLFIKKYFKKADKIIPVSKAISYELINKFNIEENKIQVIYNPYEINKIKTQAKLPIDDLFSSFITNKTIVTVGSFNKKKGHLNLLKVFNMLVLQDSEYKLIMIGDGPCERQYVNFINENRLNENVILTGFLENPFSIIDKSTIFVLSSKHEGFPNVIIEAMACGKAIISTDCYSGPSEILVPKKDWNFPVKSLLRTNYGYLTPPMDETSNDTNLTQFEDVFLQAISLTVEDGDLRKEFEIKAIERANDFDVSSIIDIWVDMIDRL